MIKLYFKLCSIFRYKINFLFFSLLAVLIFSISPQCVSSQTISEVNLNLKEDNDSIVPFKDRISFRTNTIDWLLTMPNLGFEFDLSSSPYNRVTMSLSAKGNWPNYHTSFPRIVYDMNNFKLEVRKYGRTSARYESKDEKRTFGDVLGDMLNLRVKNPNFWRAYYWGIYVDMGKYNLKFSETGRYGKYLGAGLTLGYGIPLYQYRNGALDLELGANIGAVYTVYNTYKFDENGVRINNEPKSIKKFVPYPVISELRVAFVYRFTSIKNKYKLFDTEKINRRIEKRRLRNEASVAKY